MLKHYSPPPPKKMSSPTVLLLIIVREFVTLCPYSIVTYMFTIHCGLNEQKGISGL